MINDKQISQVAENVMTKGVFTLHQTGAFVEPPAPDWIYVIDNNNNYCIDNNGNYCVDGIKT